MEESEEVGRRRREVLDKLLLELPEQIQSVRDELLDLGVEVKEKIEQCQDKVDSLFKTVYSVMESVQALKEGRGRVLALGGGGADAGGDSTSDTTTTVKPGSQPRQEPPSTFVQQASSSSKQSRSRPAPPPPPEYSFFPPSKLQKCHDDNDDGGGGGGGETHKVEVMVGNMTAGVETPFDGITDCWQIPDSDIKSNWELIRASTKLSNSVLNQLRARRKKLRRAEINEQLILEGKPPISWSKRRLQQQQQRQRMVEGMSAESGR